ncbi:hypothetical protein [Streptomyces sp. NPDC044948]|uniref:hypothetical protein n=1 Tax=Streptomyces sp. NPDC044948 TaxID=3157092 RepID=UPI0033F8A345
MFARLDRYADFLKIRYRSDFLKSGEYSVAEITPDLRKRIESGQFHRIVFSGMGCSAIVSDVIGTFLNAVGAGVEVLVFNDYDFPYLVPQSVVDDEGPCSSSAPTAGTPRSRCGSSTRWRGATTARCC